MNDERTVTNYPVAVDLALLAVRIIVGAIFAAHGAQKMFGAFGGPGLTAFVQMMGGGPLPYLVAIGEFFGGLGISMPPELLVSATCAPSSRAASAGTSSSPARPTTPGPVMLSTSPRSRIGRSRTTAWCW